MPDVLGIFNSGDFIGSSLVAEQELSLGSFCVIVVKVKNRRTRVADVVVTCYQRINYKCSLGSGKFASPFLNTFLSKASGIANSLVSIFVHLSGIFICLLVVLAGVDAVGEL